MVNETEAKKLIDAARAQSGLIFDKLYADLVGVIEKPGPGLNIPNDAEKKFDYMYTAYGSTVDKNGSVTLIPELISGKFPMKYVGLPNPAMGFPPAMIDGKYIAIINQPGTWWESAAIPTLKAPYEVWLVGRNTFGTDYEAKLPGGNGSPYLADNGAGIRIVNNGYSVPNSKVAPNYRVSIDRIVVNVGSSDYYQDGVKVGPVKFSESISRTYNGIGVNTNAKDWDFVALYVKAGVVDNADEVYKVLADKWGVGSYPNEAILERLGWSNNKGTYTPYATIKNAPMPLLGPENWGYEWWWLSDATNFGGMKKFATKRIVTTADFPAGYATMKGFKIKCMITPISLGYHSWRAFNGKFGDYNLNDSW